MQKVVSICGREQALENDDEDDAALVVEDPAKSVAVERKLGQGEAVLQEDRADEDGQWVALECDEAAAPENGAAALEDAELVDHRGSGGVRAEGVAMVGAGREAGPG